MDEKAISLKRTARLAGILYFLFALSAIYGYMYVSPQILVADDNAATGKKMLANEFLYRTGIAASMLTTILFVAVVIVLYRLFKEVNSMQAKFMAWFVLVAVTFSFIGESLKIAALQIFKGNLLKSFSTEQAQDIAGTFLKIGNYGRQLTSFHWGLWLIPLALLVYKSGFMPKILGILLFINGLGYIISSATFILFPASMVPVSKILFPTYFIGEIPLIFWMMIKGIKNRLIDQRIA